MVWLSPPCCLQGVKLLSYLYQEALDNCSNEHYPVLLSLLKTSCEPYTRWGGAGAGQALGGWAWTAAPPLPGRGHAQLTPAFHAHSGSSMTGCTVGSSEMFMASS